MKAPTWGATLKGEPQKALRERAVSFKAHALACLVCALGISSLHAQSTGPLRKTDLIRLLTANTQTPAQILAAVKRNCVSFTPTARDRQDLAELGGDTTLLKAIDQCVRERAVTPAASSARATGAPATRAPATPAAARPRPPAASQPAPIPVPRLADVPPPLVAVEDAWTRYNVGKRKAGNLDGTRYLRDQQLYATVDTVERDFDRSGCTRP